MGGSLDKNHVHAFIIIYHLVVCSYFGA